MEILDQILKSSGGAFSAALTSKAGFKTDEAQRFLPLALGKLMEVVKGGNFGDANSMLKKIDTKGLATAAGVDATKASSGLSALLPLLMSALKDKAGSADGIAALLGGESKGGVLGAVGDLAAKKFKI